MHGDQTSNSTSVEKLALVLLCVSSSSCFILSVIYLTSLTSSTSSSFFLHFTFDFAVHAIQAREISDGVLSESQCTMGRKKNHHRWRSYEKYTPFVDSWRAFQFSQKVTARTCTRLEPCEIHREFLDLRCVSVECLRPPTDKTAEPRMTHRRQLGISALLCASWIHLIAGNMSSRPLRFLNLTTMSL
ncbi:unnamed protein product [Ixodes persulcatus]